MLAVVAAVWHNIFGAPKFVADIGLFLLLTLYLASFIQPFLMAWLNRQFLVSAMREPIALLLKNANITTTVDSMVLIHLLRAPIDHLELLFLELRAEKEFFERRLSLVVGSIEKMGLGPGLLAAGISLSNIKSDQTDWVLAFAYAMPILYLFGAAAHFLLMRLDRYVKLVELAVVRTKSLTNPSSGQPKATLSSAAEVQR